MDKYEKKLREELQDEAADYEVVAWIEREFPELVESEDERIRNCLRCLTSLDQAQDVIEDMGFTRQDLLAYLEKQKDAFENGRQLGIMQEQARQELGWPDEKKKEHQNNSDAPEKALGRDLISPKDKDTNLDEIAQDYVDGVKEYNPEPTWDLMQTAVCYGYHYCEQKEQKPAEWNEEDDQLIGFIFDLLNSLVWRKEWAMDKKECLERLKSLRPQSHWKPSEGQMDALLWCTAHLGGADRQTLAELYEHLKKL